MSSFVCHHYGGRNNDAEGTGATSSRPGGEIHGTNEHKVSFLLSLALQVASSAVGLAWGYLASLSRLGRLSRRLENPVGVGLHVVAGWTEICLLTLAFMIVIAAFRLAVVLALRSPRSLERLGMSCAAFALAATIVLADVAFYRDTVSAVIFGIIFYFALMVSIHVLVEKRMFLETALLFIIATCLIASLIYNPAVGGYGGAGLSRVSVV